MTNFSFQTRQGLQVASVALAILSLLATFSPAMADDALSAAEQRLFSTSYENEPLAERLSRLESSVYGDTQSGTPVERQERLLKVLNAAQKIIPGTDAPAQADNPNNKPDTGISSFTVPGNPQNPAEQPAPQQTTHPPDATDYPTVTALEREVFGRDFIREDIQHRLSRLEKKVYGQSYEQSALVDRVDRLLSMYPNVAQKASPHSAPEVYPGSALNDLPSDPRQFAGSSRDVYAKVDALEKTLLNGKSTPNALLTERLDKLETTAYGHTYSGESVDTRVSRLIRSHEVGGQPAIGGAQPRPGFQARQPYQPPVGTPQVITPPGYTATSRSQVTTSAPQNIQIGAGFSQNSTHQFSPEMMSMLPPEIRRQMSGNGSQSNGTVVSAPSTVVIEQSTTTNGYPGFQTYGGPPIQQYNYYGLPPGSTSQSQTTTTVIQPNGGSTVYSYPDANNPNGLPNPAYVGDPAFLQSLGNLEIHVFGQVNTVEPVNIRLGKLESTVLGQMYVGYPDAQRLINLEKAYQVQAVSKLLGQSKAANMGRAAGSAMMGIPLNTQNPMNPMMVPPIPMNMGIPTR